jgi:hypothetical protein
VWPWLDLDTLLAARSRLGSAEVSVVVPTVERPGGGAHMTAHDLEMAAARHGLQRPAVVPLERWVPYAERHRILNRSSILAVLHRPGSETELSFRTRALDGVWAAVPLLLSEGGAVSRIANSKGWEDRDEWRWSVVARPLVETLSELPRGARGSLAPAAVRAAAVLVGRSPERLP